MRTNDYSAPSFVERGNPLLLSSAQVGLANSEGSGVTVQGATRDAMDPEYPLERLCSHCYAPFQLTFARHAAQVLREADEVDAEATHRGLLLKGETEAAFEQSVRLLRDYFGTQIHIGPAVVRFHKGATLEQPHMGLRVTCQPEHFEMLKADLNARCAVLVTSEMEPSHAVIRATAPLANVMGYAAYLARHTCGTARQAMWLSHYAPVEPSQPDGTSLENLT